MLTWIQHYTQQEMHRVIGLMSGTSVDGMDAACVEVAGSGDSLRARLLDAMTVPFESELRERILRLCQGGSVQEAAVLNFALGEAFAGAALQLIRRCDLRAADIDLIGSHGQTVCHLPGARATLQIGEPSIIAERTGITVVADFRPRDMAAGGEGAPLVPYADYCLLRHATRHRIIQNIGGIANCTVLLAGATLDEVTAFDSGPGNMTIDECARLLTDGRRQFDEDGHIAACGRVDEAWLAQLMRHPFFARHPPKSAGREEFGRAFAAELVRDGKQKGLGNPDIVATATALTAASIAQSYRDFVPKFDAQPFEVILGGGGASNPTLRRMLQHRLGTTPVLTHEDVGLDSDAKEAMAFAILAHETILGTANNAPGATGARRRVVLGKLVMAEPRSGGENDQLYSLVE